MASVVKTDTITGLASATTLTLPTTTKIGATAIVSASAGSATIIAEGGTTTTNLQQGLTKAWVDYTGGGTTVNDSFNLTSVTDQATGDVILTWANDAANAFYQFSWSGTDVASGAAGYGYGFCSHGTDSATLKTAASHRFGTGYPANGDLSDLGMAAYAWNGDLA